MNVVKNLGGNNTFITDPRSRDPIGRAQTEEEDI
jgi:hypothetical protein